APLTPVPVDFFSQNIPNRHHWNQSLLLKPRQPLEKGFLQATLAALVAHHDALRLRYRETPEGWSQQYAPRRTAADQEMLWVREINGPRELEQLCAAAQNSL